MDLFLSFQFSFQFLESSVFFNDFGWRSEIWKEIIVAVEVKILRETSAIVQVNAVARQCFFSNLGLLFDTPVKQKLIHIAKTFFRISRSPVWVFLVVLFLL